MSDSTTETDGTHGMRHSGPEKTAPRTGAPDVRTPQETPAIGEQHDVRRRVQNAVRQPRLTAASQVRWVRAGEVLSAASGRVAGHGIRLTHTIHHPAKTLNATAQRETGMAISSDRASRLAPLSAYGAGRGARGAAVSVHR
jgi:hypothetical protein